MARSTGPIEVADLVIGHKYRFIHRDGLQRYDRMTIAVYLGPNYLNPSRHFDISLRPLFGTATMSALTLKRVEEVPMGIPPVSNRVVK